MGMNKWDPAAPVSSGDIAQLIQGIRLAQFPYWWPDDAKGLQVAPFDYEFNFLPLVASAAQSTQVNINGDSVFFLVSQELTATLTDDTTFLAQLPATFAIKDTGSGVYFSSAPLHASNYFGTVQRPKLWTVPPIVAPNSTLLVEAKNLAATAFNIRGALSGIKVFGYKPTSRG